MNAPVQRTYTFLLTDVEGSTRLLEERPDEMRAALLRHDAAIRALVCEHRGDTFKSMGDGFFAAFEDAADALRAAVAVQTAFQGPADDPSPPLRVRVALYRGEVELRGDGDFYGVTLHRAARVRDALHGGQVVLAGNVCAALPSGPDGVPALPEDVGLTDLGCHRLRDLTEPEHLYQVTHPGLPAEFPPLRSLSGVPNNLPAPFNSFVGREKEMAEVRRLLRSKRLVTLHGPGGTGKTRLSVETGATVLDAFLDGVFFAELGACRDDAAAAATIAGAVGVRPEATRPVLDSVADHLARRTGPVLLILDNCEHLIDFCARAAAGLLRACPKLTLLATSREPLGVPGEAVFAVPRLEAAPPARPGVPEPTPEEAQERYPAVRLFADRAAAASHTFALSTGNVGVVAELCRRLDGLPLPIELAAAWSAVLPPEEMVARLSDRFQMLEAGANRPADPRHQTLRGTIDWSYDLLAEPERVLLRRLSVFPGGFTIDAAEKVCADDTALPRIAVLTGLMRLVRKSLVAQDDSAVPSPEVGAATPLPRYRLLETIREYGAELLAAHPDEAAAVRARHLDHYLALGEEAEPHLFSSSPRAWLDRLELEHGNIRAALTHEGADPLKRLRLAVAVYWFWHVRGHLIEGKNHIVRLLTDCEDTVPSGFKCRALKAYGILAMNTGEYEEAETRLREALELYRAESNSYEMSGCLHNLALVAQRRERYADARSLFEEAIATGRPFPNESREAVFLANYASLLYDTGAFDAASDILVRATAIQRKSGNLSALAAGLTTLGASEFRRGRLASAIRALTEAVEASYALGTGPSLVPAMTCLSEVAHAARDFESSALLIGAASAVTTERVVNRINAERFGPIADDITRHIGSEPFATLRHRGANLSEAEVRDIAHRLAGCEEAGYNRSS